MAHNCKNATWNVENILSQQSSLNFRENIYLTHKIHTL